MKVDFHLTAYPDTDPDAEIETAIHDLMMAVVHKVPLPQRGSEECDLCGSLLINFIARDHMDPSILFGGCICANNDCTILYVHVSKGEV
jgi:hypothetical protein